MPEPSWEASASVWAHGYLKFLDFQGSGFDVHATFQKSKSIHVSVYAVGSTTDVKLAMQAMVVGVTGVTLEESKRTLLKNVVSPSDAMPDGFWAFLENRCTQRATTLGILAPQQTTATQPTGVLSSAVPKGGSSGIPLGATWGDRFRQTQFNTAFPSMPGKNG